MVQKAGGVEKRKERNIVTAVKDGTYKAINRSQEEDAAILEHNTLVTLCNRI